MSITCGEFFKNLSETSSVSFMVYEPETGVMTRYREGLSEAVPVPEALRPSLEDDDTIVGFFAKNSQRVVVYFLRAVIGGVKCVCVVRDGKSRKNLNDFFRAYAGMLSGSFRRPDSAGKSGGLTEDKDAEIAEARLRADALVSRLEEARKTLDMMRRSRDKLRILIDSVESPLYSVSPDYVIFQANKAASSFAGMEKITELIGKKCHKAFFGKDEPCPWCKQGEVRRTGESLVEEFAVERNGRTRNLSVYFFPVAEESGETVGWGGIIVDKTEAVEKEASITKVREQLKTFKKSKISDMNELETVKRDYADLSMNYTALLGRSEKMKKTLESLMAKDSTKEMLAWKTELQEYKNKLARSYDAIKNYQRNVENLQLKYSDLNKRTFFQMERLINVMNSKYGASEGDIGAAIKLLNRNMAELKNSGSFAAGEESPARSGADGGFKDS